MNNTDPRAWLQQAQARANNATPGPWDLIGGGEYVTPVGIMVAPDDGGVNGADAEFIAAARTEHPAMAAALTAVLDWCDDAQQEADGLWAKPSTGDDITEACVLRDAVSELRKAITDNLPGGNA